MQLCKKQAGMGVKKKKNKKAIKKPVAAEKGQSQDYYKLRQAAFELVVVQGRSQKEASETLGISENTLSKWANDDQEGKWKDLREARQQCASTDAENTRQLLRLLSKQRLDIEGQIQDAVITEDADLEGMLRRKASGLSDEMSKINKTLQSFDKKSYTLGSYIDVMDDIFSSMRSFDELLWLQSIQFQTQHIRSVSNKLG